MLLWLCFALLTAAVVAALARPLLRAAQSEDGADGELAVYRDQLRELEADRERGLVGAEEAEAARVELARRLIKEAERTGAGGPGVSSALAGGGRWVVGVVALGVPLAAIALYLALGSPGLPARPLAERMAVPADKASVAELVGKVEARLRERPEEGEGWDAIAPVYMRMQRFADAADAYERALGLLGESPQRLMGLGEALIMASNGLVGEQARRTFERLRALEPGHVEARFWLAIGKQQDGNRDGAVADLQALLAESPADAPWRAFVEERLAEFGAAPAKGTVSREQPETTAPSGPAFDVAKMTAEERTAFITQMVDGLAERLKKDGTDIDGWVKLVRSLHVLGRRDEALAALGNARRALEGNTQALATLDALAGSLGLGS
ncbi:MAG: c-type cytochrome biogenesis protein CcmI [Pseudomonadota bacterium]